VFAHLAEVDDGEQVAGRVVEAMNYQGPTVSARAASGVPETGALARQPERPVTLGLRAYRGIARAFPGEFNNNYGGELLQTAEDAIEPVWRQHCVLGLARLLMDVAIRVPFEYLAELRQNVRYALRVLGGSPGFTLVALLSLTLGICIATCAYSEMNGLLRDLFGVPHPDESVALHQPVSYPTY